MEEVGGNERNMLSHGESAKGLFVSSGAIFGGWKLHGTRETFDKKRGTNDRASFPSDPEASKPHA